MFDHKREGPDVSSVGSVKVRGGYPQPDTIVEDLGAVVKNSSSDYCGTWVGRKGSIASWSMAKFQMFCNDYQGCPICRERRQKYIGGRIGAAYQAGAIMRRVGPAERKKLVRKVGKKNVFCIPQDGGDVIILYTAPDDLGDVLERPDEDAIAAMVAAMPTGKRGARMSGGLGRKRRGAARRSDLPRIKTFSHMVLNPNEDLERRAFRWATDDCGRPDTSSPEALQQYMDRFVNVYYPWLWRFGIRTARHKRPTERVDLAKMSAWLDASYNFDGLARDVAHERAQLQKPEPPDPDTPARDTCYACHTVNWALHPDGTVYCATCHPCHLDTIQELHIASKSHTHQEMGRGEGSQCLK